MGAWLSKTVLPKVVAPGREIELSAASKSDLDAAGKGSEQVLEALRSEINIQQEQSYVVSGFN